ncbi:hypothetical protein CERSUDRAFT_117209 [Gelatoporia subvermispora B]|uniref:Protein kinase domain-containing protein n=1 Tax=Ceriporiopsis subvermispora (strain B) TaxID=914234 RepID=M2PEN1_CERS8|nr:hypothetical protein CERSUDRAFT_117209 [Gelatoporia subvermispora B]
MIESWSGYLSPSSSASSSTRSSHLSVLTSSTSSSVHSPLPSPSVSTHSIGSKTHAFFASPFSDPIPLPPPNPPKRSESLKSDGSAESSTSYASGAAVEDTTLEETPRMEQRAPPRSLNANFFGPSTLPTPPPSLRSFPTSATSSRENSPPALSNRLPPASRLFPSRARFNTIDGALSREGSPRRREFLHLEVETPPRAYPGVYPHAGEHVSLSADLEAALLSTRDEPPSELTSRLPTPIATEREAPSFASESSVPPVPDSATPVPPPMTISASDPSPAAMLEPGKVIGSASLTLALVRPLGQGAFSSVWLARDVAGQVNALELTRKTSLLRSKSGKRGRLSRIDGTKPRRSALSGQERPTDGREDGHETERARKWIEEKEDGGRLVAVKMTERSLCEKNARTRVSFVREVEVLRHISHPSIVSYLHSFSTASHHCLVLEHISGGELFDLIDSTESHARLEEPLLRRMFGELCKAVGWMHGVGLVHRDIKLENILLTCHPLREPLPHGPLVKLSDFGLSRFIDPAAPLLTTLCGSESYAAPELVMGHQYDGRETDAWACGVVLFALAARRLPFDKPGAQAPKHEQPETPAEASRRRLENRRERKALLVRIAKGEYEWPDVPEAETRDDGLLRGLSLVRSEGVRRIVGRLLVRDSAKRAKIIDLWDDEWMRGEGAPLAPAAVFALDGESDGDAEVDAITTPARAQLACTKPAREADQDVVEGEGEAECPCTEDGVLVDGHDIGPGSVARQEH